MWQWKPHQTGLQASGKTDTLKLIEFRIASIGVSVLIIQSLISVISWIVRGFKD